MISQTPTAMIADGGAERPHPEIKCHRVYLL